MRISYRQGLISAQSNFLQTNAVGSNVYVDIVVSPTPVIASIAFRDRDYLIDETVSVPSAWGPFSDTQTYYLFWEILPDGNLSRSSTLFSPVSSTNPPTAQVGQMWWDNSVKVMKVFDGFNWVPTLRVLAGSLHGGNVIPSSYGSQVGLNIPTDAGYILRDAFQNVFRDNNGNFLTSTSPLTSSDTGPLVKFDGTQLTAQANEPIPKFSLVYLRDGRAALASGIPPDNIPKAPLGMVTEDSPQNAAVTIVTAGKTVFNEQWDFAISDLGHAVFCGPNGEVTPQKPLAQKNMRVGTIITKQSILLNFDWETEASIVTSGVTGISVSAPLNVGIVSGVPVYSSTSSMPMINIQRATSNLDGFMNASDFARIPALELLVAGKSDIGHTHLIANVAGLQGVLDGKANVSHTHVIVDVTDLPAALLLKSDVGHSHNLIDISGWPNAKLELDTSIASKIPKVLIGAGNFPMIVTGGTLTDSGFSDVSFALASHTHVIVDVTDLPAALLLKSDVGHTHAIADVTGLVDELAGKALTVHSHIIDDVADLQSALDNKSNIGHTHAFTDIPGLQIALDGKALTNHGHVMADVTDLAPALALKSNTNHVHTIDGVTGLQIALDSKADVNHTQLASSITDFGTASYNQIAGILTAGSNISIVLDSGAETVTINSSSGDSSLLVSPPDVWRIYEYGRPFDSQSLNLIGNRVFTLQTPPLVTFWRADEIVADPSPPWTNNTAGIQFLSKGIYKISLQTQFSIPQLNDGDYTQPYFPDNCQLSYGTIISNINAGLSHQTILSSTHYRYGPTTVDINSDGYKTVSWFDEYIVIVGRSGGIKLEAYMDTNGGALAFYGDGTGTGIKQYMAPTLLDMIMMMTVVKLPGQTFV